MADGTFSVCHDLVMFVLLATLHSEGSVTVTTDLDLLESSLKGDERAFALLFDRHADSAFRYALSRGCTADEAQEVTQEAFIVLWRRLRDVRMVGDSVLPWLLVTVRNIASASRRRISRIATAPLSDYEDLPSADLPPVERLQRAEQLRWVAAALEKLDLTDRRMIELCIYQGLDYQAAAKELGLRPNGVAQRMHRVRNRLKTERSLHEREATS